MLASIAERLTPAIVPMGAAHEPGTRDAGVHPVRPPTSGFTAGLAELLADHDDALLAAYVDDPAAVTYDRLRAALAAQTRRALVHPVFFGSAITGAGVEALTAGIAELLPATDGDPDAPLSGTVFKVERGPAGEKIAYARLFSGTVHVGTGSTSAAADGTTAAAGREAEPKVTAIRVFEHGAAVQRQAVVAGQIAQLWGLADVRIGDALGAASASSNGHHFAPPTLETVVVPRRPAENGALHAALAQLAEQDPLIDLRQDDVRQEIAVSLYGEVQKEVIQATLATEYGLEVDFRETTTICVERPIGTGAAVETISQGRQPVPRHRRAARRAGARRYGLEFRLEVDLATIPLYVYKSVDVFKARHEETVLRDAAAGALRLARRRLHWSR